MRTWRAAVERLDRLERPQVETEVRLATELVSVVGAFNSLRTTILEDRALVGVVQRSALETVTWPSSSAFHSSDLLFLCLSSPGQSR